MSTTSIIVDIHSKHITLDELRDELRVNPSRLEEKKMKIYGSLGITPLMASVLEMWRRLHFFYQLALTSMPKTMFEFSLFLQSKTPRIITFHLISSLEYSYFVPTDFVSGYIIPWFSCICCQSGKTALAMVAGHGQQQVDVVQLLLNNGANVNVKDKVSVCLLVCLFVCLFVCIFDLKLLSINFCFLIIICLGQSHCLDGGSKEGLWGHCRITVKGWSKHQRQRLCWCSWTWNWMSFLFSLSPSFVFFTFVLFCFVLFVYCLYNCLLRMNLLFWCLLLLEESSTWFNCCSIMEPASTTKTRS